MSDESKPKIQLVERLRSHVLCIGPKCENREIMYEAADRIEAQKREMVTLELTLDEEQERHLNTHGDLVAARERIEALEQTLKESLCPKCKGSGEIYKHRKTGLHYQDGDPMYETYRLKCPKCDERNAVLAGEAEKPC